MATPTMDPILTAHIEARAALVRERYPQIDHGHYIEQVLLERSQRYAAHLATMTITPDIVTWALAMTRQYGPYVLVSNYVADWITALLLVRYGEEERGYDAAEVAAAIAEARVPACSTDPNFTGWPTQFTDDDRQRAAELLAGDWPTRGLMTALPRDPRSLTTEG